MQEDSALALFDIDELCKSGDALGVQKKLEFLGRSKIRKDTVQMFIDCYNAGFKCYYCGCRMKIAPGSPDTFTFDHGKPKAHGGDDSNGNLHIVCIGCNLFKNSIKRESFQKILSAIKKEYGEEFYQQVKQERAYPAYGKGCGHRPRKVLDLEYAVDCYNNGKPFKDIAKEQNVSTVTLWKRMREAGYSSRLVYKNNPDAEVVVSVLP